MCPSQNYCRFHHHRPAALTRADGNCEHCEAAQASSYLDAIHRRALENEARVNDLAVEHVVEALSTGCRW